MLTPGGAVELFNACTQIAGQFKQAGILKETPTPPASNGDAKEARPVRAEPGRTDLLPTSLDSLEQQMASLLRGSEKKS